MKHFCEAAAFEGFSKIKQIYISGTEASFMVFFSQGVNENNEKGAGTKKEKK